MFEVKEKTPWDLNRARSKQFRSALFAAAVVLSLSACGGGGSGAPAAGPNLRSPADPSSPVVTEVELEVHGGAGFECFALSGRLFCRGNPSNNDLKLLFGGAALSSFTEVLSLPDVELLTWDDTLCVEGEVSLRPVSRSAGRALYCFGEATLNGSYVGLPVVYGGPMYVTAVNGSAEFSAPVTPFMGADLMLEELVDPALTPTIVSDGTGSVSLETLSCTLTDGITLTCPDFTLEVSE